MSQVTEQRSSTGPTPGDFTIDLLDNTPTSVRQHLTEHPLSYLFITPVHLTDPAVTITTIASQAIYAGQIRGFDRGLTELSGSGLAVLLGDEDGKGDLYSSAADSAGSSATFSSHITANLTGRMNGISVGTIGSSTAFVLPKQTGDTRRDWIDFMCEAVPENFEWDVTHYSYLLADTPANLFPSGQVIFTRDAGGRDGDIIGARATIELGEQDWSDLTSEVVVDYDQTPANFKTATNSITNMVDLTGGAYSAERYVTSRQTSRPNKGGWAAIRRWLIKNATNAQKVANREAGKYDEVRQQLDVTCYEYAPRRLGIYPGVTVYLYAPELGLVDTSNQVQYRGQVTFPVESRIFKMTWPVQDGMGVMHFHSDGAGGMTLTDLTRYVDFNPNPAVSLEVGALRRNLELV